MCLPHARADAIGYSSILGITNQRSSPVLGPMSLQAEVNWIARHPSGREADATAADERRNQIRRGRLVTGEQYRRNPSIGFADQVDDRRDAAFVEQPVLMNRCLPVAGFASQVEGVRARIAGDVQQISGATPALVMNRPTRLEASLPCLASGRSSSEPKVASQSDLPCRRTSNVRMVRNASWSRQKLRALRPWTLAGLSAGDVRWSGSLT